MTAVDFRKATRRAKDENARFAQRRTEHRRGARLTFYALCVGVVVMFVFPLAWSALASLRPAGEANNTGLSLPGRLSGENYTALVNYGDGLPLYLQNTLLAGVYTVVGTILVSFLAGYAFSQLRVPFANVLFGAILLILVVPYPTVLIPLYVVLGKLGLANSLFGVSLIYITFQLPFAVFMMRNAFDAVPKSLIQAALIDGATTAQMLRRVLLPLVMPGVITVGMFAFLAAWNEFLAPLIFLTDSAQYTLPVMILNAQTGQYGTVNWGVLQAGVTIAMLPCVALFLLLQRYYIAGFTSGAVKG